MAEVCQPRRIRAAAGGRGHHTLEEFQLRLCGGDFVFDGGALIAEIAQLAVERAFGRR